MRIARLIVYVLMFLYLPFIFGLIAAMAWGAYSLTVAASRGKLSPFLIVSVVAVDFTVLGSTILLLFGLLPLFFHGPPSPPPGILIREGQHPRLFKLIQRVVARLGIDVPDAFFLDSSIGAGIGEIRLIGPNGEVRNQRVLIFGAELVIELQVDEFTAILCHEIAHASGGDTVLARRAHRFFRSMGAAIESHSSDSLDQEGPGFIASTIRYLLMAYFHLFAYFYQMDNRARELRADRLAAEVCGASNMRNALIRIAALDGFLQLNGFHIANQLAQREEPVENLFDQYRKNRAAITPARLSAAESNVMLTPHTIWSSHPRITDRIKVISAVESKGISAPQPATSLFTDWPNIERRISDELMKLMQELHKHRLKALDAALRTR